MSRSLSAALSGAGIALFASVSAGAQLVQGTVVAEKSHQPIGGAHLALVDDSGLVAASTIGDSATGVFYLTPTSAGHYRLKILVGHGGLAFSEPLQLDSGQTIERTVAVPDWPKAVLEAYLPDDVTIAARLKPGGSVPRYPDRLRAARQGGMARVVFVVDREGRPDMSSFQVLHSDDLEITESVRRAVSGMQFVPAQLAGTPVSEVFQLPIYFVIGDADPAGVHDPTAMVIHAVEVFRTGPP
jgi:TonB family protein